MKSRAVLVLMLAGLPGALAAQVEPVVELRGGALETVVRNPGPDKWQVTVELLARTISDNRVVLGRAVAARISPASFTLDVGERQVVRVRLREAAPTPTLGLAITMTPVEPAAREDSTRTAARFTLVIRHVAKVLVQ